jgi:hypothetical protein
VQVRAGVDPFSVMQDRFARLVDVSAGAFFDIAPQDSTQGGYLELGLVPWVHGFGDGGLMRIEPNLQGRLLYDPSLHAFGQGVAAQVSFEFVTFTDGQFDSSEGTHGAFGYMFGEAGLGLYVEGAYEALGDLRFTSFSAGVQVRIPSMFGFAWGIPN